MSERHQKEQATRAFAARFAGRALAPPPRSEEELAAFHKKADAEWGLQSGRNVDTIVLHPRTGELVRADDYTAECRQQTAVLAGEISVAAFTADIGSEREPLSHRTEADDLGVGGVLVGAA